MDGVLGPRGAAEHFRGGAVDSGGGSGGRNRVIPTSSNFRSHYVQSVLQIVERYFDFEKSSRNSDEIMIFMIFINLG